jgi:hypothetical protein
MVSRKAWSERRWLGAQCHLGRVRGPRETLWIGWTLGVDLARSGSYHGIQDAPPENSTQL